MTSIDSNMPVRYSVVGLGKLGASMAAAIASRGFEVIGVDVNQQAVDLFNSGKPPVEETGLAALLSENRNRLNATTSHREAIQNSEVTFIIVPTPSDDRGAFSLQYAKWAFREIGKGMAGKDAYHLVVMTSTVLPGSLRFGLLPVLEHASGKVCGRDFGLCYSPEFIALGSVIHDFLNPDFTLVGEFDEKSGDLLENCYRLLMPKKTSCVRMTIENAELTKIALNSFVTMKITFANMIAEFCERLPGGDADRVCCALGLDRRIGPHYLKGALGYGGPCFPRDNLALAFFAKEIGTRAPLAETTDRMNRDIISKVLGKLKEHIKTGDTAAVLGLAYKPHSHVVEESQGVQLARALASMGIRVVAYDPLARQAARHELKDKVLVLEKISSCLRQADAVVITTPDPEFCGLDVSDFPKRNPPVAVFDCWRILRTRIQHSIDLNYIPIGIGADEAPRTDRLKSLWLGEFMPPAPVRKE